MKSVPSSIILIILVLVALSCNLADRLAGGDQNLKRTNELWSDVPRIDGLEPSDMEMPFAIKVLMRTVLNNLWRLNDEGEDKTPVEGDWIVFTTSKTPLDVQGFYTNERMTSFGNWEASKKSTCLDGKESSIDGAMCLFEKVENGRAVMLAVVAMKDDSTKKTNLFYLRLQQDAKPGVANTSEKTVSRDKKHSGPITPLTGSAPYEIEKRPMPTGMELDKLLPKTVGPYERVTLEKSEERGATPTAITTDGSSVYATYRSGDREIFVELGVNSTPENAQASLDVAASEVTDGLPTDPKLGSLGTEPSYVRAENESGAFIAWTRGGYYFSANAKGGVADLNAFMNAFPY